jgi:hypothetical protein
LKFRFKFAGDFVAATGVKGRVREMVQTDLNSAQRDELIKSHGYKSMDHNE